MRSFCPRHLSFMVNDACRSDTGDFLPSGPIIDSRRGCWLGEDLRFSGGIDFLHTNPVWEVQIWLEAVQQPHSAPDTTTFVSYEVKHNGAWVQHGAAAVPAACVWGVRKPVLPSALCKLIYGLIITAWIKDVAGRLFTLHVGVFFLPHTTCDSHSSL